MRPRSIACCCWSAAATVLLAAAQPAMADAAVTVWSGVYSAEQALRGMAIYTEHCESCHAADMRGGPAVRGLVGLAFQMIWKDRSLSELFDAARTRMPPGNPGALDDQGYADVLASILQRNGFPPGATSIEPDPDALNAIVITWQAPDAATASGR